MSSHPFITIASFLAFSIPATALAQTPPAEPAPPPPAAAAPAPAAPAAPPAQGEEQQEEKARFRWGISAIGGPILYSGSSAGAGGVDVRFGAQINKMFAVYGQPVLLIGGGASASVGGTNVSASALVLGGTGVLADITLGDLFYIAAGPELLGGAAGSSSSGTAGSSASASSGAFFSVAARTGFALGSMKPERRKAFTIGLDFRAIFTPGDPVVAPLIALGYESF
jgi:hypothetical protein